MIPTGEQIEQLASYSVSPWSTTFWWMR